MTASTPEPGSPTSAASIRRTASGVAASPSSSDRISTASTAAISTSSTPIIAVPAASQRPSSVANVSDTPNSANTRPSSAPRSSSSTTGSSGAFARRTNSTHDAPRRSRFDSTTAVRSENDSITIATTSTVIGTHCHSVIGSGCSHLWYAS
jgi:hypothetical protein